LKIRFPPGVSKNPLNAKETKERRPSKGLARKKRFHKRSESSPSAQALELRVCTS
jgi:hypothetical protein